MTDKTLVCKDCGSEFIFSVGEQEFYKEKGFENEPQRCLECRKAKKQARRSTNNGGGYSSSSNRSGFSNRSSNRW